MINNTLNFGMGGSTTAGFIAPPAQKPLNPAFTPTKPFQLGTTSPKVNLSSGLSFGMTPVQPQPKMKTSSTPTKGLVAPNTSSLSPSLSSAIPQKTTPSPLQGGTGIMNGPGQQGGVQGTFTNGIFTPSQITGTPQPGQTQAQANTQSNLPQFQGGQQISGTGGPTFPGTVGQLVNTSQNQPGMGPANTLAGMATAPGFQTINGVQYNTSAPGFDPAQIAAKNLQDFQTKYAGQVANVESMPIGVSEQTGRGAIMQQQANAAQAALQQNVANVLEQRGQNITALGTAGGLANTAQGLQQGGLTSAAGLAAPSGNFPFTFNPLTGGFSSGGIGGGQATQGGKISTTFNPQTDAQNFAQAVINKTMPYSDAVSAMAYAGNAGKTILDNVILSGGGDLTSLQAESAIKQTQIGQINTYKSALQQGQNLQSQLSDLIKTFGLNPSDINAVNIGLQTIASNVSNPYYKQLQNYVNDIANTYAQILTPPGGSQTDTSRGIATSMLDATSKGTSILSTMQSLDQAALAKIAGVPTIGGSSTNTNSGGGFTEGATASNGQLVYKNGQWVVNQ